MLSEGLFHCIHYASQLYAFVNLTHSTIFAEELLVSLSAFNQWLELKSLHPYSEWIALETMFKKGKSRTFNSYMDLLRKSRLNRTCFLWEQEEILPKSKFLQDYSEWGVIEWAVLAPCSWAQEQYSYKSRGAGQHSVMTRNHVWNACFFPGSPEAISCTHSFLEYLFPLACQLSCTSRCIKGGESQESTRSLSASQRGT